MNSRAPALLTLALAAFVCLAPSRTPAQTAPRSGSRLNLQRSSAPQTAPAPTLRYGTRIRIESEPPAADVFIDGQRFGRTPLLLEGSLRPGTHRLVLTLEDYLTHEETIRVGRDSVHRVELRPDVPTEGVNPLPAEVREVQGLDGARRYTGKTDVDRDREAVAGGVAVFDSSLQVNVLLGSGGRSVESDPGTRYFTLRVMLQQNFTQNFAAHLGVEFDIAPTLDSVSDDPSETGSMNGFALDVGVPFYLDRIKAHAVAAGLAGGLLSHGYSYQASNGAGGVKESARYRYIQPRVGAFIFYEYLPEAEHGQVDTGFRLQVNAWNYGPPAERVTRGKPSRALDITAGLAVRF